MNDQLVKITVEGMACPSCAASIETKLKDVPGILGASVDFFTKTATVRIHNNGGSGSQEEGGLDNLWSLSPESVASQITSYGYAAKVIQNETIIMTIEIEGMACTSCAASIEKKLQEGSGPGIVSASVEFLSKMATVEVDGNLWTAENVAGQITSFGYTAKPIPFQEGKKASIVVHKNGNASENFPRKTAIVGSIQNQFHVQQKEDMDRRRDSQEGATTILDVQSGIHNSNSPNNNSPHFLEFIVSGMSCASCAANIEAQLKKMPIVKNANVNFATTSARVEVDPFGGASEVVQRKVQEKIESLGYTASLRNATSTKGQEEAKEALKRTDEIHEMKQRFFLSLFFSVPLFIFMIVVQEVEFFKSNMSVHIYNQLEVKMAVEFVVSTPVVVFFGRSFFVKAAEAARHKTFTMDTLVAVGVGGAYLFSSIVAVLALTDVASMPVYFDAASSLTTFMLLGRFLEANAKKETSGALIALMELSPDTARLVHKGSSKKGVASLAEKEKGELPPLQAGEKEEDKIVPCSQISVGDIVRVLAAERIPVDGVIQEGSAAVDEQLITGESVPKEKKPGDQVVGGTLCLNADILVKATGIGDETVLHRILKIVREAQTSKPAIQRIADRIAGVFVPCVISFCIVVLTVWVILGYKDVYPEHWRGSQTRLTFAFGFFLSSMVVACPCALGLATPTAIMVGTGVGAANGILIKSGVVLETATKAKCVLFDKTGTLTYGKLSVVSTMVLSDLMLQLDAADDDKTAGSQIDGPGRYANGAEGLSEETILQLIGSIESRSTHPVGVAITKKMGCLPNEAFLEEERREVEEESGRRTGNGALRVETVAGSGLRAKITLRGNSNNHNKQKGAAASKKSPVLPHLNVSVGNMKFIEAEQVEYLKTIRDGDGEITQNNTGCGSSVSAAIRSKCLQAQKEGLTVVLMSINGIVRLVTCLSDEPKEEASAVVATLQAKGILVQMVSGDNKEAAEHIAAQIGIHRRNVHAEVLPTKKYEVVKDLQEQGHLVVFVGDGLNDGPALSKADIGVALGAGTEVAIDAADAVLIKNSLEDLICFLDLSATTVRRIYLNFIWAFVYNICALPLASGMFYPLWQQQIPPLVAGIAMIVSSLTVLASSLLLKCYRRPKLVKGKNKRSGVEIISRSQPQHTLLLDSERTSMTTETTRPLRSEGLRSGGKGKKGKTECSCRCQPCLCENCDCELQEHGIHRE